VTRMISRNYEPLVVRSEIGDSTDNSLDVCATKNEDGKTLVLQVVNPSEKEAAVRLTISGFTPAKPMAQVETLAGESGAQNTAGKPESIRPTSLDWKHGLEDGETSFTFPAHSFTVIRF